MTVEKGMGLTIGILMILGLSLGIGFGVYQMHDGKNLRDLSRMYGEMREEAAAAVATAKTANEMARRALQQAAKDRERLADFEENVRRKLEEP